ncbi:hypothetical protein D0A34_16055 [Microcoleus vaginatus PCC 9802]|uniref:hypothetical protein n=1 Tax=Microcoleus vaginatus TaxID=119532 RepID=UPI0002DD63CE|nr:hypothetical protein D0A34_16055 [Microcoleus vaginatus PCC 9802]
MIAGIWLSSQLPSLLQTLSNFSKTSLYRQPIRAAPPGKYVDSPTANAISMPFEVLPTSRSAILHRAQ